VNIDSDMPIHNLISNVGTGNTLHFCSGCNFTLNDLTLMSGNLQLDQGASVNVTGTMMSNNDFVIEPEKTGCYYESGLGVTIENTIIFRLINSIDAHTFVDMVTNDI